jgi:hypothetical protein
VRGWEGIRGLVPGGPAESVEVLGQAACRFRLCVYRRGHHLVSL